MKIEIFSLQDVIREHNGENGTQYSPEENFGCLSLSNDALKKLDEKLKELSVIEDTFKETDNTYSHVNDHIDERHREHLKEREAWYESQVMCFDDDEYWNGLFSRDDLKKSKRKVLEGLKKMWRSQKEHVAHTSLMLAHIARKIIPEIQAYLKTAKAECRQRKTILPKPIKDKFKAHITEMEDALQEYNDALVNSMLMRLKVAEKFKNWKADDVIMYVLKRIEQHGLLDKNQKRIFQAREGISQKIFSFFIDYILLNGSADQKMNLVNGAWFSSNPSFQRVKHGDRYCLVPTEMLRVTPRFYFSSTLFSHRHFRREFFHQKIGLITRVKTLDSHTKISKYISIRGAEKLVEDLLQLENEMKEAYVEAESWRVTNWKRYFYRKTNQFVSAYAHFTHLETQKLAEKKLEVIHVLRLRVETDLSEAEHKKEYINPHLINRAIYLCDQLQQEHKTLARNEQLNAKFENDRSYFQHLLTLCDTKEAPFVHEAPRVDMIPPHEPEFIDEDSTEDQVSPVEIEAKGVFETTAQVDLTTLTDRGFDQLVSLLTRTIEDLPRGADDGPVNLAMSKHFISYLECCNEIENIEQFLDKKERIQKIENLLEHHGPGFIKTRIASLIKIRDLENNWFGFKTLCGIYLQSCALQDDNKLCLK